MKLKKCIRVIEREVIKKMMYINMNVYKKMYTKYLRKIGVNIIGSPNFICNDVYFDGSDYNLISLGDGCTISREVVFLTHDFCMHTIFRGLKNNLTAEYAEVLEKKDRIDNLRVLDGISIGNNSFIGARALLLPGTKIGNNCIIGGTVVKGEIPDNSIVIGNPAEIVGEVGLWISRKACRIEEKMED